MMKKIMSLAMAAIIAVGGFSAMAKPEKKNKVHRQGKELLAQKYDKKQKSDVKKDGVKVQRPGQCCSPQTLLEGITLSPLQQQKVDALQKKSQENFAKEQKKREKQEAKERKDRKKIMEKRMKELDKEMQQILTPEQYSIFKQNVAKAQQDRQKMKEAKKDAKKKAKNDQKSKKAKSKKGPRDGKAGKKAMRQNETPAAEAPAVE